MAPVLRHTSCTHIRVHTNTPLIGNKIKTSTAELAVQFQDSYHISIKQIPKHRHIPVKKSFSSASETTPKLASSFLSNPHPHPSPKLPQYPHNVTLPSFQPFSIVSKRIPLQQNYVVMSLLNGSRGFNAGDASSLSPGQQGRGQAPPPFLVPSPSAVFIISSVVHVLTVRAFVALLLYSPHQL